MDFSMMDLERCVISDRETSDEVEELITLPTLLIEVGPSKIHSPNERTKMPRFTRQPCLRPGGSKSLTAYDGPRACAP